MLFDTRLPGLSRTVSLAANAKLTSGVLSPWITPAARGDNFNACQRRFIHNLHIVYRTRGETTRVRQGLFILLSLGARIKRFDETVWRARFSQPQGLFHPPPNRVFVPPPPRQSYEEGGGAFFVCFINYVVITLRLSCHTQGREKGGHLIRLECTRKLL